MNYRVVNYTDTLSVGLVNITFLGSEYSLAYDLPPTWGLKSCPGLDHEKNKYALLPQRLGRTIEVVWTPRAAVITKFGHPHCPSIFPSSFKRGLNFSSSSRIGEMIYKWNKNRSEGTGLINQSIRHDVLYGALIELHFLVHFCEYRDSFGDLRGEAENHFLLAGSSPPSLELAARCRPYPQVGAKTRT
jgi:hypothetical protein